MILMTARLIKLALVLGAIIGAVWLAQGLWSKKQLSGYVILTVFAAFIANFAASALPPLTDQITLTGMGQKREEAVLDEIFLDGYTVDGRAYVPGKSLQIVDGKWFWIGESYVWRNSTDARQPEGVTASVTVKIPVGWSRTLDFRGGVWRGFVEISSGGKTWIADTYSEDGSAVAVQIGRSETSALLFNQSRYLIMYAVLLMLWFFVAVSMIQLSVHQPERYRKWMERNAGKPCYAVAALTAFLLMLHFADTYSLGLDELIITKFASEGVGSAIQRCVESQSGAPPLGSIVLCPWYYIAPYGEKWLLLFPIFLTAMSVYVIGIAGERLQGKWCGFFAACMMGFSSTVWGYSGISFKSYSLLFFSSTFCLYSFIQKNRSAEQGKWLIAYSVSLFCVGMTHYFGMMLCGIYFLADLYLFFKKKVSWRSGCAYIFPGSACLLWVGFLCWTSWKNGGTGIAFNYAPVPTISHVVNLLRTLAGNYEPAFWLLMFAIACAVARLYFWNEGKDDLTAFYQIFMAGSAVLMIEAVYFYGRFINQEMTLWMERYFILLIPQTTLLCASVVTGFGAPKNSKRSASITGAVSIFFSLLFALNCISVGGACRSDKYTYRETADWLYEQGDYIFNGDALLATTMGDWEREGWIRYYVERYGRRDPLSIIPQYNLTAEDVLSYNRVYLFQDHLYAVDPWLQTTLDENYRLETERPDIQMKVYTRE